MLNRPYEKAIEMLEEAKNQEPELASFYHFYQDIFRLQHEAGASIHGKLELTDKDILEEKASQGQPLISFVHLPVEPDSFGQLAAEITRKILDFQRIEQS